MEKDNHIKNNKTTVFNGKKKVFLLSIFMVLFCFSPLHNEDIYYLNEIPVSITYEYPQVTPIKALVSKHASSFTQHGIDVARYQRQVDWEMMKRAGIDFAFIKATEGLQLVDSYFVYNWNEAKKNNIRRGAYHFFIAEKDAAHQAVHFVMEAPIESNDLPPVLDVEVSRGKQGWEIRSGMRIWLSIVEKAYGKKPVIYSNKYFYDQYLAGYFEDYPLWIADYRGDKAEYEKYKQWKFWQHTDKGEIQGVMSKIDLNVFNGSRQQLDSFCHARISSLHTDSIYMNKKLVIK